MGYKIVVCINKKGYIGKDGDLMYHISNDLKNFKSQTIGNVVIMGRKTFESLPNGKPLKDRINIVLTSDANYRNKIKDINVFVLNTIEDVDYFCRTIFPHLEWFVIGGGSVYKAFLKRGLCDEIRLTTVYDDTEGDTMLQLHLDNSWRTYYHSCKQSEDSGIEFDFKVLKKA